MLNAFFIRIYFIIFLKYVKKEKATYAFCRNSRTTAVSLSRAHVTSPLIPPLRGMEGPLRILAVAFSTAVGGEARFNPRPGGQPGHFPEELPKGP